ncbi:hypothetical protein ACFQZC_17155 [Streptacidiphilus monticola]
MTTESTEARLAPAEAPVPQTAPAVAAADPRRWWVLVVISFAQFIIAIDASVVNVMGPQLQHAIHLSTLACSG